jgi:exosome complex component RRP42
MTIGQNERAYISQGIEHDIRTDARKRLEYNPFYIQTGVISQASGSCRLSRENSDILVTVNVDVKSDREYVQCNVDYSASFKLDSVKTSQFFTRLLNNQKYIDLEALNITSSYNWCIIIDVLVLDYNGNLYDSVMLAIKAALHDTKMPRSTVKENTFDISQEETESIPGLNIPVCVSFNTIGHRYIVDASLMEEQCTDSKIVVAVDSSGSVCHVFKDGTGVVEPSLLKDMFYNSQSIAKNLDFKLMEVLNEVDMDQEEDLGYMV